MQLKHSFTVPVEPDAAWATFQDIGSVAQCFPGAVVTSVEGDSFEGTCKVKLGPVALQYAGSGSFVKRDESARKIVLEVKGKDKRGNGTAGATVMAAFESSDPGSTQVEVLTDLKITGKPAQFGRGVMQDVSDKLLGQFVECLQAKVTPDAGEAPPEDVATPEALAVRASAHGLTAEPGATLGQGVDDALDLRATVLPVLVRTYGWPLLAGTVALLILRWVRRRR